LNILLSSNVFGLTQDPISLSAQNFIDINVNFFRSVSICYQLC